MLLRRRLPHLPLRRRRRALRRADHDRADRRSRRSRRSCTSRGGGDRLHLMVENPAQHFEQIASAGGDSVTFHYEAVDDVPATIARRARARPRRSASRSTRRREPERRRGGRGRRRPRPLHEHPPRLLGPGVHAGGGRAHRAAARAARPSTSTSRSTAGSAPTNIRRLHDARRVAARRGVGDLRRRGSAARVPRARATRSRDVSSARSSSRARRAGRAYPKPPVGAVVVARRRGRRRGRRRRPAAGTPRWSRSTAAGERARGATLYVTLEPCAHHGTTPPCADAVVAAGVARVVVGARDPNPEATGGARAAARGGRRGRARRLVRGARRRTRRGAPGSRSGGRSSPTRRRSRSTGASPCRAARWVSGEESRRRVHELRAAVGRGRGRRRDGARRRAAARRARRRDAARPAAPARLRARPAARTGSSSSCARGALDEELRALARGGRPVAAPRGRPDARRRVPRGGPRRQAARSSSRRRSPGRGPAALPAALASPRTLVSAVRAAGRRQTCSSRPMSTSPDIAAHRRPDRHASQPLADAPARERRAAAQGARRSTRTSWRRAAARPCGSCSPSSRRPRRASGRSSRSSSAKTVETLVYGD